MAKERLHEVQVSCDNGFIFLQCDDCNWIRCFGGTYPGQVSLATLANQVNWTDYNEELYFYHD